MPLITELPTHSTLTRTVLSENGIHCAVLMVGPAEEVPPVTERQIPERLLFVAEGEVTVHVGDLFYILKKDEVLRVASGREHTIVGAPGGWSRVLRIDLPPQQIVTEQILTLPSH